MNLSTIQGRFGAETWSLAAWRTARICSIVISYIATTVVEAKIGGPSRQFRRDEQSVSVIGPVVAVYAQKVGINATGGPAQIAIPTEPLFVADMLLLFQKRQADLELLVQYP